MKVIHTDKAPKALGPYSQAIQTNGIIYLSGQIGIDPATGKAGTTIEEQTQQIMQNIDAILTEAGTDVHKVVKTTCFLANMSDFEAFNKIYGQYFVGKPARSCVAVKELPAGILAEVEVVALAYGHENFSLGDYGV